MGAFRLQWVAHKGSKSESWMLHQKGIGKDDERLKTDGMFIYFTIIFIR